MNRSGKQVVWIELVQRFSSSHFHVMSHWFVPSWLWSIQVRLSSLLSIYYDIIMKISHSFSGWISSS